HSVDGLKVFNNLFADNGIEGIEVKTLDREAFPPPIETTLIYENVDIYNNTLIRNGNFGLAISNQYSDTMSTKHILIHDNQLISKEVYQVNNSAMRLVFQAEKLGDVQVYRNVV